MAVELQEMDERVTFREQLQQDNRTRRADQPVQRRAGRHRKPLASLGRGRGLHEAAPGYISTQLHRGIGGSTNFINIAVWESAQALARAFGSPEFQARTARYPDSAVAAPHLFEKVAVAAPHLFEKVAAAGICVG
jgi:heme-degrading monooxygenase HmoA